MDIVMKILEIIVLVIKLVSVIVLLLGLLFCIRSLLAFAVSRRHGENEQQVQHIKNELGRYVLLGLEILIIADIIESIINPSFKDIGRLAAIVAIRTVISYFLNKEIQEAGSAPGEEHHTE